jgi:hypothetical protein
MTKAGSHGCWLRRKRKEKAKTLEKTEKTRSDLL